MTNKDIKNAYVGTTEVKAMYLGSTKVYPTGPKKAMGVAVITDNCAFCVDILGRRQNTFLQNLDTQLTNTQI